MMGPLTSNVFWELGNEKAVWLLFLVPALLIPAYIWSFYMKRRALATFAHVETLARINSSVSVGRQILKAAMLVAGFAFVVIALMQPKWNPKPMDIKRTGRDVVILLDTSRSMLGEDLRPNRLEAAKLAIGDLLETLKGDRVAIVTFAGNVSVKCPLTQDYAFARMALADISTESNARGGTKIGDALRTALDTVFDDKDRKFKDIILITDGEDHDSFPVDAAAKVGAEGIRIIAVGLGNQTEGTRIPVTGENDQKSFLKYNGQEVWSKLDAKTLREMAFATPGGRYVPVETGTCDLGRIYDEVVASAEKKELASTTMMQYDEKFQIFLAIGLLLIAGEVLVSERKSDK
jgi:Ca-activated chloride channel homolog